MADPVTWAIIGTAITAGSAIAEGQAAKYSGDYNAQVAEQNARISTAQAEENAARSKVEARRRIGTMMADYGASGVGTGGSPSDVLVDSYISSELDAATILYEGKLNALSYRNSANLYRTEGKNAKRASYFKAASSALLGGADAYGK